VAYLKFTASSLLCTFYCLAAYGAPPKASTLVLKEFASPAAFKTELEGTWTTRCNKELKSIVTTSFQGNTYKSSAEQYADSECKKAVFSWKAHGTFEVGKRSENGKSNFELDITVKEVDVLPLSKEIVAHFEKQKYCGISQWKLGDPVSVKDCKKDSMIGKTCYGLAAIKDGQWINSMASDDRDCSSKDKRHIKLDFEHPYYKSSLANP
jgi:hypothetical protein